MIILSAVIVFVFIISVGCTGFYRYSALTMDTIEPCPEGLMSGDGMILNETHNNATICLKNGSSFTLQLNERSRVGYSWIFSESPAFDREDNGFFWFDEQGNTMSSRPGPGRELHEWRITAKQTGIQTLKGNEKYFSGEITGNENFFNLTMVVE